MGVSTLRNNLTCMNCENNSLFIEASGCMLEKMFIRFTITSYIGQFSKCHYLWWEKRVSQISEALVHASDRIRRQKGI
jgi:hypothetical protein